MKLISAIALTAVSAMDTRVKTCWDVRIPDDYFCGSAVLWPIADDVFYDAKERDDWAREQYTILKIKYLAP